MDGGTVTSTRITVGTNGLLNGQGGNIVGNVSNNGGTITPGDATGVMTVTGNYTQNSGVLLFEIDGVTPSQFDRVLISGLANITGGSIDVMFGAGFMPAAGENFDLLSATLGLNLANVNFAVIGLPANLLFTETVGANGFQLEDGKERYASRLRGQQLRERLLSAAATFYRTAASYVTTGRLGSGSAFRQRPVSATAAGRPRTCRQRCITVFCSKNRAGPMRAPDCALEKPDYGSLDDRQVRGARRRSPANTSRPSGG
jgi:hypothetical protein